MTLITCIECSNKISDLSEHCIHCGAPLLISKKTPCFECGNLLEIGVNNCDSCGVDQSLNPNVNVPKVTVFENNIALPKNNPTAKIVEQSKKEKKIEEQQITKKSEPIKIETNPEEILKENESGSLDQTAPKIEIPIVEKNSSVEIKPLSKERPDDAPKITSKEKPKSESKIDAHNNSKESIKPSNNPISNNVNSQAPPQRKRRGRGLLWFGIILTLLICTAVIIYVKFPDLLSSDPLKSYVNYGEVNAKHKDGLFNNKNEWVVKGVLYNTHSFKTINAVEIKFHFSDFDETRTIYKTLKPDKFLPSSFSETFTGHEDGYYDFMEVIDARE